MTDEQILNALKSCGDRIAICDDCPYKGRNHCSVLAKQDIITRFEQLQAENAALRERLEKAVELKAKRLDVIYMPWVYDGNFDIATLQIIGIDLRTNGEIAYITNLESDSIIYLAKYSYGIFYNADFDHIVFTDRSKAEARLAELKGEK